MLEDLELSRKMLFRESKRAANSYEYLKD
uniref:Uncharacterized protein n=1 Tax=Rhizophora mucronata TaxID=61149 RepID=A0A2P2KZ75_RHIMU